MRRFVLAFAVLLPAAAAAADFREQLEALATKCDELGLVAEAKQTRGWLFDRAADRQYLFLANASQKPAGDSDLQLKWQAKFMEIRADYAQQLWERAKQEAANGNGTHAIQLLYEVLHHDPSHAAARRVLKVSADESRPRIRQPNVAHAKLGWQRGRWWQITSPHFQVATNAGQDAGLELAKQLEDFHTIWRQVFFDFWSTPEDLSEQLNGGVATPVSGRKHQVVLFRNRDEYVRTLSPIEPKIHLTLGYYLKGSQTSYFYAGDESALSVWYHEAAHQLFQETGQAVRDVGEKWNFWLVEGIAVYLESAVRHDGYFTLGGFDADRLQFVRSRVMGGDRPLPIDELSRLGREALQAHPEIRKLYTQAAGLTHYLMDAVQGRYRGELIRSLQAMYAGQDTTRSIAGLSAFADGDFEQRFRAFLVVDDEQFQQLDTSRPIKNLSLAGAKISDESLKRLAGNEHLQWLDLAYAPITDEGLGNLGPLPKLERLTLVNTRITDQALSLLDSPALPRLEELDLSGTAITDAGLVHLGRATGLKTLRLTHTAVSDAGLVHLVPLRNLEELDVDQTQVTARGLEQIKSQLPKLQR